MGTVVRETEAESEPEREEEGESVVVKRQQREEKKLAIMMMTKKRRRLYEKVRAAIGLALWFINRATIIFLQIMKGRKRKAAEVKELRRKRVEIDTKRTANS